MTYMSKIKVYLQDHTLDLTPCMVCETDLDRAALTVASQREGSWSEPRLGPFFAVSLLVWAAVAWR